MINALTITSPLALLLLHHQSRRVKIKATDPWTTEASATRPGKTCLSEQRNLTWVYFILGNQNMKKILLHLKLHCLNVYVFSFKTLLVSFIYLPSFFNLCAVKCHAAVGHFININLTLTEERKREREVLLREFLPKKLPVKKKTACEIKRWWQRSRDIRKRSLREITSLFSVKQERKCFLSRCVYKHFCLNLSLPDKPSPEEEEEEGTYFCSWDCKSH